jgi:hypothetical protein
MNRYLTAVFALQLAVVLGVYLSGQQDAQAKISQQLVSATDTVERLQIVAENGNKVVIARADGQWRLPDYHQLPADQGKVTRILDKLQQTQLNWPVTTQASSHQRFKVEDDGFVRKVALGSPADEQTLLLGSSPGFRQLHLRRDGEDEVYAVKLNSYDFPAKGDDWLDKSLLRISDEITALKGSDFELQRDQDQWRFEDLAQSVNDEQVTELLTALKQLNVSGVSDLAPGEGATELTLTADGESLSYQFANVDDQYLVTRSDYGVSFRLSKAVFDKITGFTQKQFVVHDEPVTDEVENS